MRPAVLASIAAICVVSGLSPQITTNIRHRLQPPTHQVLGSARPAADSATKYLNEALDLIERLSIEIRPDTWPAIRADALREVAGAQNPADTYTAITVTLRRIGAKHSSLMTPAAFSLSEEQPLASEDIPRVLRLADGVGYVTMPPMGVGGVEKVRRYVKDVRSAIATVDQAGAGTDGWIVDLRANSGGNMWPMLAGLQPLIGEGTVGSFIFRDGITQSWRIQGSDMWLGSDRFAFDVPPYSLRRGPASVAVLIGFRTGSSGEFVAVAFKGRPRTRLFGGSTSGFVTGVACYPLADGARLCLANSRVADRSGIVCGDRIDPDEFVEYVRPPRTDGQPDDAIDAALRWLEKQRSSGRTP